MSQTSCDHFKLDDIFFIFSFFFKRILSCALIGFFSKFSMLLVGRLFIHFVHPRYVFSLAVSICIFSVEYTFIILYSINDHFLYTLTLLKSTNVYWEMSERNSFNQFFSFFFVKYVQNYLFENVCFFYWISQVKLKESIQIPRISLEYSNRSESGTSKEKVCYS